MAGLEAAATMSGMGGGAATTDIFGLGRIVDEASEVLDSLDRPVGRIKVVEVKKNKTSSFILDVSKLDMILFVFFASMIVGAIKLHSQGISGTAAVQQVMTPFTNRMLLSGTPDGSEGGGQVGVPYHIQNLADTSLMAGAVGVGPAIVYELYKWMSGFGKEK